VYQEKNGKRQTISGHYVLKSQNTVGFVLGDYDPHKRLIIDPVLRYSTYLGGSSAFYDDGNPYPPFSSAHGISVDSAGNAYVTGSTSTIDFPTTSGAYNRTIGRQCIHSDPCFTSDGFVTKINARGTGLVYSTFVNGPGAQPAFHASAVDSSGNVYVAGLHSFGGPGGTGILLMKFNSTGSDLLYSIRLGPYTDNELTDANSVAVDSTGNAYLTGGTTDPNLPVTPAAFQSSLKGSSDAFVLKLDTNKSGNDSIVYWTYLGGSTEVENGWGITLDGSGNAYVVGFTGSSDFPQTSAFGTGVGGAFVTKMNPTGTALLYSSIIHGVVPRGLPDRASEGAIAIDSARNAYITGAASSSGFPRTAGAFRTTFGGGAKDAFVLKLSPGGTTLLYSTYLGGSGSEHGLSIAVDSSKRAYVAGKTNSANFPVTSNAVQKVLGGGTCNEQPCSDAFVTVLNPSGTTLSFYSTYLGGSLDDHAVGIAIDKALNAYVAGSAASSNFPVTAGAFQTTKKGDHDVFVSKLVIAADLAVTKTAPSSSVATGSNLAYTIKVLNKGPDRSDALVLTDALPSGTTFVGFTTSGGSCTHPAVGTTGTLTCRRTNLFKSSTWTVTMTVKVRASRGSTIKNTARVTAKTQDLVAGNNTATTSTQVN
jgi:uncharacterized repeat protein (TIGR01451 family)